MGIPIVVWFVIGMIVIAAAIFYAYLKLTKGTKLGVNLNAGQKNTCANCGEPLPKIRKPQNLRQILWGGGTCQACGTEYDKWMNPIQK